MFVLGVSWLVLTPLCLWNLFRGGRLVRLTSVMALVALEAATIWATATVRVTPPTPVVAAPSAVAPDRVPSSTGLSGPSPWALRQHVRSASCGARTPAPERVRPARRQSAVRDVTLFWTAGADGCAPVTAVLRHRSHLIR